MMSWSKDILADHLVRFNFPRQHRQANRADHEERGPRTPQRRLDQQNLTNNVIVEIGDAIRAGHTIESAEQTRRDVLHQCSEADDVSPTCLEHDVDELAEY